MRHSLDKFLISGVLLFAVSLYGPTVLSDHKPASANRVVAESDTEIQYMSEEITYEEVAYTEITTEDVTTYEVVEEVEEVTEEMTTEVAVEIAEDTSVTELNVVADSMPEFLQEEQDDSVVKSLIQAKRDSRFVYSDAMAMIKSLPTEAKPSMIAVEEQAKAEAIRANEAAFSEVVAAYNADKARQNARKAASVQMASNPTTPAQATPQYQTPTGDGVLTASKGVNYGPSGKETYYNLNMSGVVQNAKNMGIEGEYWVREDGVKMYGEYVMVAANLNTHPRGSIVESSLGTAIVVDTGGFAASDPNQLDIATAW